MFFRKNIESKKIQMSIYLSIFIFPLASIILTETIEPLSVYPSFSIMLKSVLISAMAFFFFKEVLNNQKYTALEREPLFWFVAGIIIYAIGSFFTEGIMKYAIKINRFVANKLFYISLILSYIFRIFTIISFLFIKKNK
jgi:hypothetical protein